MDELKMMTKPDFERMSEVEEDSLCGRMVVGMAYFPMQKWVGLREPEEALARGTQFEELDKPFFGEDIWGCM